MKVWIISWRYLDGSGSGVLPTAYQDEATADHVFGTLVQQCDTKMYELEELNVLRTEEKKPPTDDTYYRTQYNRPPWFELINSPGTPLRKLNLTLRTESCLTAEGMETVEQLLLCRESILLRFPNLGRKSLNEIREALAARGLELKK